MVPASTVTEIAPPRAAAGAVRHNCAASILVVAHPVANRKHARSRRCTRILVLVLLASTKASSAERAACCKPLSEWQLPPAAAASPSQLSTMLKVR